MVVKFDYFDRYETPAIILCKPCSFYTDGTISDPIAEIQYCSDIEFEFNFNDKSTLNFRVNLVAKDSEYYKRDKEIYDKILKHMYVFVEDVGYFRIDDISEYQSEYMNYKDVSATSCEAELSSRGIPYIADGTYSLRTVLEKLNEQVAQWDLSSQLIYFDEDLEDTPEAPFKRTFADVDVKQNVFDFMTKTVQDLYECVFIFDTINRKIAVYARSNYSKDTSVHLTKSDVVSHITAKETDAGAYSVLSGYGDDDLTFSAVNPLGTNAVFNFNYYLSWMPESLATKVSNWQSAVTAAESSYYNARLAYNIKYQELLNLRSERTRLNGLLSVYTRCLDNIRSEQSVANVPKYNDDIDEQEEKIDIVADSTEVDSTIDELESLIDNTTDALTELTDLILDTEDELNDIQDDIDDISDPIQFSNAFTAAEYKQLSNYMFEGTYTNDNIIITDIMTVEQKLTARKTLYNDTKRKLSEISSPVRDFDVDTDDFLFASKFSEWTNQIETGATIYVETIDDTVQPLYLTTITVNYEDQDMKLKFCSSMRNNSNSALFKSVFDKVAASATSISRV